MTDSQPEQPPAEKRPADVWPKLILATDGVLKLVWIGVLALGTWSVVDHFVH